MEIRHQIFSTPIADGPGSYQVGPDGSLAAFPPYTTYTSRSTGLSYLSYTYPKPAWSVGVFRSEVTRFSISAQPDQIDGPGDYRALAPRDIRADLLIEVYGVAGAWRATPTLWIGGAVTAQKMTFSARQLDRRDPHLNWGQHASGDDTAPAGTLGILWRPTRDWRVGAVYRGGANLDASYAFTCGERPSGARPYICTQEHVPNGEPVPSLSGRTKFKVPDVYSLGVAYALNDRVTASVQYDRIEYSQLLDGLSNSLTVRTDPSAYAISDAGDVHFGIEALSRAGSRARAGLPGRSLEGAPALSALPGRTGRRAERARRGGGGAVLDPDRRRVARHRRPRPDRRRALAVRPRRRLLQVPRRLCAVERREVLRFS